MSTRIWSSRGGTAYVELDANASIFRFESDREWLEEMRKHLRRVATLDHEVALTLERDAIEPSSPSNHELELVVRFEGARKRSERLMSLPRAGSFIVRLSALVAAHHAAGGEVLGAFDPSLVVETEMGDRVLAPGMARITQQHDSNIRGIRGGGRVAHCRVTHDQLRSKPGLPDEVTSLAVLFIELVSGKEPYPTSDEFAYMQAVVSGAHHPLEALVPQATPRLRELLAQALRIDASTRPTFDALREAILAEPGVLAQVKPQETELAAAKPWWKLW